MKCVQFAINVFEMLTHVYKNTPQPCRQLMKFKIMIINIKLKSTIKLGTSEMMCIEMRAHKLPNSNGLPLSMHCECTSICVHALVHMKGNIKLYNRYY